MRLLVLPIAWIVFAGPASAHFGDHGGMSFFELLWHGLEPDHLTFGVLTIGVGIIAYWAGKRAGARSRLPTIPVQGP
jgi:hypothetical protein